MDGSKDLIIHPGYERGRKTPLVTPSSPFEELMYLEMTRLNKKVKIIKEILEVRDEK